MKKNCWEIKNCGRQAGGCKEKELGVCPASNTVTFDKKNDGINGGRYCWRVAGTFCGGQVQGSYAQKEKNCTTCEVFKTIKVEQGSGFSL